MKVYKPAKKNIHPYIGQSRVNKRYTQSRPSFTKLYWLGGILAIIVGVLGWWLLLSPTFRLTAITASQAKNFSADDLKNLVWDKIRAPDGLLPKDNLWLVDTKAIGQALTERYYLDKLKIGKNWPHQLNITFEEKNYALAWSENNNYYLINYQGDIISQGAVPPNLLIIYNRGAAKAGERRVDIGEKYLTFADNLNKAFAENIKGLNDRQFFLDDEINTVKIQIASGPVLKFNTEDSIDKQLIKLETIRKQELSDGRLFNSQQYLDLRYGDRIFYQ